MCEAFTNKMNPKPLIYFVTRALPFQLLSIVITRCSLQKLKHAGCLSSCGMLVLKRIVTNMGTVNGTLLCHTLQVWN